MAFSSLPPFMQVGLDGTRSGFSVELAEMIGAEIGVPIEFIDLPTVPDVVAAQASGRGQVFAGVVQLPGLSHSNVLSDPVATERLRLTVLDANRAAFDNDQVRGRRIGVLAEALGSEDPILAENTSVTFVNAETALVALLSGSVDVLLMPPSALHRLARIAGFDGRIAFLDDPFQETSRHVALHESRAELLGPINEAIARLEADGRLSALRQLYEITVPPSPPDVLTVGVGDYPPFNFQNDDGTFSGFAVEVLRRLARLSDLKLEFKAITHAEFGAGPSPGTYDMLPQAGVTAARSRQMDFTDPIQRVELTIFTRSGEAGGIRGLDDLGNRKVGVEKVNIGRGIVERHGGLNVTVLDGVDDLLAALTSNEIDAIVYPSRPLHEEIRKFDLVGQIEEVLPPFLVVKRAPALRPGLGPIRERLNRATQVFLVSEEYEALRQEFFGTPKFWTQTRISVALIAGAVLFLGLVGGLFWQRHRQRQREFERQQAELTREQAHSEKLGTLVAELERSNRDLDEFAYIASHDLKEPLRGIGINANFLLREGLTGKAGERVLRMNELTSRMEQLITDLLFFSRLGHGDRSRTSVELKPIVGAIRADLSEWLAEHGAEIIEIGEIPALKAERVKVKIVLQNLIVNAIKYNDRDKKCVEIGFMPTVEVNGRTMENAIFVRDNGIGIGEEHRDKIFRIFSRLNKNTDYNWGSGTGSGLAFVRKIVEEHGGEVDFISQLGQGSTFLVTFPVANNQT